MKEVKQFLIDKMGMNQGDDEQSRQLKADRTLPLQAVYKTLVCSWIPLSNWLVWHRISHGQDHGTGKVFRADHQELRSVFTEKESAQTHS